MKMKMKAILVAMLAVVSLFTACSKSDDAVPASIGFSQEVFGIDANNEATLKVTSTSNVSGDVSFTVNTTLKEGEDYQLEKSTFSFVNNGEATVKVKFLKGFDANVTFAVELKSVSFGQLALAKANVGITTADAILYTFDKEVYNMTASADITLQLSKVSGSFTAEKEIVLAVEVDPSSTAVEGVHFSFDGAKELVVLQGQNKATLKLNFIKHEAGKDNIVLKLKNAPIVFNAGNYDLAKVQILGSIYNNLKGSWKYVDLVNLSWWRTDWGENTTLFPTKNTAADIITFDEDGIKVSMTGDVKNYFRNSAVKSKGETVEYYQENKEVLGARANILLLDALANVTFSATEINERQAEIGFRTITVSGKQILEVTVRDYEPVDFVQNTWSFFKAYGTDVPKMKSAPLRFHFEKVN